MMYYKLLQYGGHLQCFTLSLNKPTDELYTHTHTHTSTVLDKRRLRLLHMLLMQRHNFSSQIVCISQTGQAAQPATNQATQPAADQVTQPEAGQAVQPAAGLAAKSPACQVTNPAPGQATKLAPGQAALFHCVS